LPPQLTNTPQELNSAIQEMFLCNPKDSTDFRNYEVQKYLSYDFSIRNKNLANKFLVEIQDKFRFTIPLPKSYMSINLTDKLELPQDANKISQMNLTIPINIQIKENKKEEKPSLLLDTTEITSYLQNIPEENKKQLLINNYKDIQNTITILKKHFSFN
ncbi:1227_t:CDS:2, partial [Gigaspora margarita]